MWLSKRIMYETPEADAATLGTVSIGGEDAAVVTDREKRRAKIISPGGYCWQPDVKDDVLVVKGNELYLAGKLQKSRQVEIGEVMIYSDKASILLKTDGKIEISGDVYISGNLYVNDQMMEVP